MIRKFQCKAEQNAPDKPVFRLSWEWVFSSGKLPELHLLYRAILEDEILGNSLFDKNSILVYMQNELSSEGVSRCMENHQRYTTKRYALSPNKSDRFTTDIDIDTSGCLYYFCLIEDKNNIYDSWVMKSGTQTQVKYKNATEGIFNKRQIIALDHGAADSRRIILQTGYEGHYSYSLLPHGYTKYYIEPNTPNFKLMYLSDLITI